MSKRASLPFGRSTRKISEASLFLSQMFIPTWINMAESTDDDDMIEDISVTSQTKCFTSDLFRIALTLGILLIKFAVAM